MSTPLTTTKFDVSDLSINVHPMPRVWRCIASVAFIAIWMAIGFVFHPDGNSYLLIGIPLTIIFHGVVKREPLQALWVRTAPKLMFNTKLIATIAILMVVPIYSLIQYIEAHSAAPYILWMVACLIGVFAAAYSLQNFDKTARDATLRCLGTGGLAAIVLFVLGAVASHKTFSHNPLQTRIVWFLLYFPALFLIEEVSFRGAIDSFVQRPGESHPWLSALFVSTLWGLWHLPTIAHPNVGSAIVLIIFHCIPGIALSFAWRRCGNLAAPAIVHALIDAVRNALGLMG